MKVHDETIRVLKRAIANGKLGRNEEMQALKRLDDQARQLEAAAKGPSLDAFIAKERGLSATLGGRSVFGWEKDFAESGKTGSN